MKSKQIDSDKKNSYFLNMIDKNYHSQKISNHHIAPSFNHPSPPPPPLHSRSHHQKIKSRQYSSAERIETPNEDEQELLIIDQNQPPMKRAFHRPFNFKVPMKSQFQNVDHHPGGSGGLGTVTFFRLNQRDQSSNKISEGKVDLNQQRKKLFRNTISNFGSSIQKIRLKSIQGLKANIHQKMMQRGTKNIPQKQQKQSITTFQPGIPLNFQLRALNYPINGQTGKNSIRCCTPEQIFKDHTGATQASKSAGIHYAQNSSNLRSLSDNPYSYQISNLKSHQTSQPRKQKKSDKNIPNSKSSFSKKGSPNQKSQSLKDISTVKWKSSLNHWAPLNKSKSTRQIKQVQNEKIILQNKQIEAYYRKLLQQRKTAKQLLLSQQDEALSSSQSPMYREGEEFKLQTFRPEGEKATVFRLRKNSDFQRHLKQSLGLNKEIKKRQRELVDGKNFLFSKFVNKSQKALK